MNNAVMRKIDVTATYTALASTSTIATVTISALIDNAADVYLEGDTGDDVPLVAGEWHTFESVDLSRMKVRGTVGDAITAIGGTW